MNKVNFTAKQKIGYRMIMTNQYSEIFFDGAARSGKTFLILYCLIFFCFQYSGIRILVCREKLNHAISSIWIQTLKPMLEEFFLPAAYKLNETLHIITFFNGSEIWLGGLDSKERIDKIFGQEYAIIFPNEIVQINKIMFDKLKTRLAQKIKGLKNFMISDCNPRSPAHWAYKRYYIKPRKKWGHLNWQTVDNKKNIASSYIQVLKDLPETERRRFLDGEWCEVQGAVYKNIFDSHVGVVSKNWGLYDDVVIGIDFGYHTAANVWGIKRTQKGKLRGYCMYEFVILGGTTDDLVTALKRVPWLKRYKMYCDHEPDRIETLCQNGFIAVPAYKDIGAGDSSVNTFELFFDRDTCETFQSMLNLMHGQDKNGNYIEQHVKEADHEADAGRYALHGWRKDNDFSEQAVVFLQNWKKRRRA